MAPATLKKLSRRNWRRLLGIAHSNCSHSSWMSLLFDILNPLGEGHPSAVETLTVVVIFGDPEGVAAGC